MTARVYVNLPGGNLQSTHVHSPGSEARPDSLPPIELRRRDKSHSESQEGAEMAIEILGETSNGWGFYRDLMGFYSDLMGFYRDLMRIFRVLMGFYMIL